MNRTQVWHDVYDGEIARSGDLAVAKAAADEIVGVLDNGKRYQRLAWRRAFSRHWREWWVLYMMLAVVGLAIGLPVGLANPATHWGGIPKRYVPGKAESSVVGWYKLHYPSDGAKKFDNGLYLTSIGKVARGPVHFWSARFTSDEFTKDFCVLVNSESYYVEECAT